MKIDAESKEVVERNVLSDMLQVISSLEKKDKDVLIEELKENSKATDDDSLAKLYGIETSGIEPLDRDLILSKHLALYCSSAPLVTDHMKLMPTIMIVDVTVSPEDFHFEIKNNRPVISIHLEGLHASNRETRGSHSAYIYVDIDPFAGISAQEVGISNEPIS